MSKAGLGLAQYFPELRVQWEEEEGRTALRNVRVPADRAKVSFLQVAGEVSVWYRQHRGEFVRWRVSYKYW